MLALSACGPDDIASPGTGGNVTINNPPPRADADPDADPDRPALVTPAAGCPTISDPQGLTDSGTITGPDGTWRVCTLPRVIRASSTLPQDRRPALPAQRPGRRRLRRRLHRADRRRAVHHLDRRLPGHGAA